MFDLPSGLVTDINTNATAVLSELSPVYTLIIGVLLGATVIGFIISAFHHK